MTTVLEAYKYCDLCPRSCGVDRTLGGRGRCHAGAVPRVAHTMLHMWEEPCISGTRGSGTVFFSGCSLGCVYCQNAEISGGYLGAEYDEKGLASLFLSIEAQGAHNINLVTAAHHAPHISKAIFIARERGLSVPVVYNTSGYESQKALALLSGRVDIYLTDFRYHNAKTAARYSSAPDYPDVARRALDTMIKQVGAPQLGVDGLMQKGVIVRLLLLPGHLIEAKQILKEIYSAYGDSVYISLMSQYTPRAGIGVRFPSLARTVTPYEYASLVAYAQDLGVTNAFTQEGSSATDSFIPPFLAK